MCDITDEEFDKIYLTFYNNVNDYLNNYVIPDLITFYLAMDIVETVYQNVI